MVNAFEYFDEKNRDRIHMVKEKLTDQKVELVEVKNILELVKSKITKNENSINFPDRKNLGSGGPTDEGGISGPVVMR